MAEKLTNALLLFDPRFLGSAHFLPGETKVLTIKGVRKEQHTFGGGRKEDVVVMYFNESDLPMIVNKTNARLITRALETPFVEKWVGCRIALAVEVVAFKGDQVQAVRVSPERPKEPEHACASCGSIIKDSGKYTATQIARASTKKFGKPMCMACSEKAATDIATGGVTENATEQQ